MLRLRRITLKMKINIAVWWVLDYETGSRETLGGLERWTRDMVIELVSRGHQVSVYQKSAVDYKKSYHGAAIFGIASSKNFSGNLVFYKRFREMCNNDELTLFVSQDLLWGRHFKKAIAVNHGVWWSSRQSKLKRLAIEKFNEYYLKRAKKTICVDTNYINWAIESVDGSHNILQKLAYIPNYFDPVLFGNNATRVKSGILKILFPRRIMGTSIESEPRGGEDAIRALAKVRGRGIDATITMLGEGNLSQDLKVLASDLNVAEHVSFKTAQFDDMPEFYASHDIVFVPSRFSEGTSLSAIEGLAAGCYVIGSCVGGLQNLPLFPPYGRMVVPHSSALAEAVVEYVNEVRNGTTQSLGSGDAVIDRLSIAVWKQSVLRVMTEVACEEV